MNTHSTKQSPATSISWNDKEAVDYFLRRVNRNRKMSPNGMEVDPYESHQTRTTLRTYMVAPPDLTSNEVEECILKALNVPHSEQVTAASALKQMNTVANDILKSEKSQFCYVTTISNISQLNLDQAMTLWFNHNRLAELQSFSIEKISKCRTGIHERHARKHKLLPFEDTGKSIFYLPVEARSSASAHYIANRSLDLFLAVISFHIDSGKGLKLYGGIPKPYSAVINGPIRTVHLRGTEEDDKQHWYQPNYRDPSSNNDFQTYESELLNLLSETKQHLEISPLKEQAENALIRYGRSLEQSNWLSAFKELWSTLEFVTNASKYEIAIRRAASHSKNYDHYVRLGEHLRLRRNAMTHSTYEVEDDNETFILLQQLKFLVHPTLERLIINSPKLETMEEFGEFLDVSRNQKVIDRKLHILKSASDFYS